MKSQSFLTATNSNKATKYKAQKGSKDIIWRFSTAWYGTVRHGSLRHDTAQLGSVCVSTAV